MRIIPSLCPLIINYEKTGSVWLNTITKNLFFVSLEYNFLGTGIKFNKGLATGVR